MVVPLPNGDVDVSLLKEAVDLVNGQFETEVVIAGLIGLLSCIELRFWLSSSKSLV